MLAEITETRVLPFSEIVEARAPRWRLRSDLKVKTRKEAVRFESLAREDW